MKVVNKTKNHGPFARRAALGAAMVLAAAAAACSSSDSNLVSPSDGSTDARFSSRYVPSAPLNPQAVGGDASATVSWSAPSSSGATKIMMYTVVTQPGGKSTRVSASTLSTKITGLTNGQAYTFAVYASNFFGNGPSATTAPVMPAATTTPPDTTTNPPAPKAPTAPTGVNATAGNAQATINWTAPSDSGSSKVVSYTVTSAPGGMTASVNAPATSATITGLTNGTAYTFTVTATNASLTSPASSPSSAVTPAAANTAPSAPRNVSATATASATASVKWEAPASDGGSTITSYVVTSSPGNITTTVSGSTMQTNVGGLTNGTAYTFTVVAKNTVGTSPASAASNAVTPQAAVTVPGAPASVSATAGNAQATITWTAPASNGGATISGYTVTSTPGGKTATVSGATLSTAITGLTNGTSYTFAVYATNSQGNGATTTSNAVTPTAPVQTSGKWISGYWVGYNRALQNENQIDMSQLTHIMVGRADVVNGNQIATGFFVGSNAQGAAVAKTITARAHAAGKKAIMMIGGSDAVGSLQTASNSSNRAGFITNLLAAMDQMNFDGIDVDWEPISTADQPTMLALVQGLRQARPNMIITVPLSWVYYDANSWYATLAQYVDQMNFMSYGMDVNYDGWVSWHFSAVQGETANHPSSINKSLTAWQAAGVAAGKLGAGVGAYGDCWKGITGPNQAYSGQSASGGDNGLPYSKIMSSYYSAANYKYDATAQAGYLSSSTAMGALGCNYLTYESEQGVTAKAQFVKAKGMGGIMFWTIDQQYIAGASGVAQNPLINAAWIGLNQ